MGRRDWTVRRIEVKICRDKGEEEGVRFCRVVESLTELQVRKRER